MFRSESKGVISQLSALKTLPPVCVIDLDFHDRNILTQLKELRTKYSAIKLIAHSDIENEKVGKALFNIGFVNYLLIGSDIDDIKKAIDNSVND